MQETKERLSNLQSTLTNFITHNLWQVSFKFSQKFKHPDINILNDNRVKAVNTQGYKFVLMEPHLDQLAKKTFSFQVKESKSNWLAIGFCHQSIVEAKGYSFVFGSIGHGAYMISSNGGSWSNHKTDQNNTLKGIKFSKGDTVHATIDPQQCLIIFTKNTHPDRYELPYILTEK
jgi:hypothetical protein